MTSSMVFRKTNALTGRNVSVTPANSTNRLLSYGRIILGNGDRQISFQTSSRETALIVLSGRAHVGAQSEEHELSQFDGIYIPRDSSVHVSTDDSADVAEF